MPLHDLPPSAVAALKQGRKIEAIKVMREEHGIGLREAKEEVEAWLARDPSLLGQPPTVPLPWRHIGTAVAAACLMIIIYNLFIR